MEFQFRIDAKPIAQPRPRARAIQAGGRWTATVYDPKKHPVQAWKSSVLLAWKSATANHPQARFERPVGVQIELFTVRNAKSPVSRHWDIRRPSKSGTGDADNFAKSVLDALNGTAWNDDGQVAHLLVQKTVAAIDEQPHAWVSIWDLDPPEAGPGSGNLF